MNRSRHDPQKRRMQSGPNVYHVVPHTHWDREWYLSFERFRTPLVRMMDDLLAVLESNPDFRSFTLDGQSILLEDYLAVKPRNAGRIRRLLRARRLFAGPWYVLPDEFLVSGEALVRNLMAGRRVVRDLGGRAMRIGYIPDSFGHAAMIPAILRGFGIRDAVVYRGFGGEQGQESSEYRWESPDGSSVLMVHLHRHGYSGAHFAGDSDREAIRRFLAMKKEVDSRARTPHRLLLSGGDHFWPDASLPAVLTAIREATGEHTRLSSLPEYFACIRSYPRFRPPVVKGELRSGYRYAFVMHGGVYSSRMPLKQANHLCQNLLERYAEPIHLHAVLLGLRAESEILDHAWKTLLQNHPHDSICGCSIDSVHRDMEARFRAVQDIAHSVIDHALERIVPEGGTPERDDASLVVYNPSPWSRSGVACADVRFHLRKVPVGINPDFRPAPPRQPPAAFALLDAWGREVPLQILQEKDEYDIRYSRHAYPTQTFVHTVRIRFAANDIPPTGFAAFRIVRRNAFTKHAITVHAGKYFLENEFLRVDVRPNGSIDILDKERGHRYRGLHVFEDGGDAGDEYTYSPPPRDKLITSGRSIGTIAVTETGPVGAALRVCLSIPVPAAVVGGKRGGGTVPLEIESVIRLEAGYPLLLFETTVRNTASDHRLRVVFPTAIATRTAEADSAFAVVERVSQDFDPAEYPIEHPPRVAPLRNFVSIHDEHRAFTVYTAGLPEYELSHDGSGRLSITLLRCVGQLGAEGLITRPGGKGGWHNETPEAQCHGVHTFRYAVFPHAPGAGYFERIVESSEAFHLPFLCFRRKSVARLPDPPSLFSFAPNAVPSAMKLSEDGMAAVVRFWNPGPDPIVVPLKFHGRYRHASHARIDETPVRGGSSPEEYVTLGPHAVRTIRFEFT
ncbi:MAG: glycoside hydrolase family 38 C-terminal domain-containing protein [Bacteroidota bacterium]|nr:glycoside hydrolase family 38 C-terminal domain-containing protein [Bacteroidota bacterium]